jgi:hypothetical protein
MADPIKITIKGTDSSGVDAPTVDDLLAQIQDFVAVLKGVESAISNGSDDEIIWRVTNVTKNSPLAFELTPYPRQYAMNIDSRAEQVILNTYTGFQSLTERGERPAYFSDAVIAKAEKVCERVTNGLEGTTFDFSRYSSAPIIILSRQTATKSIKNIAAVKTPTPISYRELGSIEGYITTIEKDGYGRPIVWIKTRLDSQIVKCVADGDVLNRIGHIEVEKVWEGLRVRIFGTIFYKALGKIESIYSDRVQFFDDDSKLPSIDKIIDPTFAAGIESATYLKRIRDDE